MKRVVSATLVLFLVFAVGCGQGTDANRPKTYPVTGTVAQGGSPIEGVAVTFHPVGGSQSAIGMTDASGKYSLTTFSSGDGAVPGEYQVTLTKQERVSGKGSSDGSVADTGDEPEAQDTEQKREKADAGPASVLPEKYADPATSGLKASVTETGENKFDFDIE